MKPKLPLQKNEAIRLLGGTPAKAAAALQYTSRSAVSKWPETLPYQHALMVLGAVWLAQQAEATTPDAAPPEPRRTRRRSWLVRAGRLT